MHYTSLKLEGALFGVEVYTRLTNGQIQLKLDNYVK